MSIGSRVDVTFAAVTPGPLKGEINSKTTGIVNLPTCLRFLTTNEPTAYTIRCGCRTGSVPARTVAAKPEPFANHGGVPVFRWNGHALELTVPHKTVAEPR
jgi:hypothetical protein